MIGDHEEVTPRQPESQIQELDALSRQADEDRWLAARFADPHARARLAALYAFYAEVAKVADVVSDPMVGRIRLQWWREAVEEACAPQTRVRDHPVARGLAMLQRSQGPRPAAAQLIGLIDARERDLEPDRFADMSALIAYVDATAGALMGTAAACLVSGVETGDGSDAARTDTPDQMAEGLRQAGRAWGLTGLVRAFAHLVAAERPPIPEDVRVAARLRRSDLAVAAEPEKARAALDALHAAAREAHQAARINLRCAPEAVWPAYGYAALAPAYLRAAAAIKNPYGEGVRPAPVMTRLRLISALLRSNV